MTKFPPLSEFGSLWDTFMKAEFTLLVALTSVLYFSSLILHP